MTGSKRNRNPTMSVPSLAFDVIVHDWRLYRRADSPLAEARIRLRVIRDGVQMDIFAPCHRRS